jgi:hypothetical protein
MQRQPWYRLAATDSRQPTAASLTGDYGRRALCPRCGSDRAVDYGAQVGCGRCGACWQADAELTIELPAAHPDRYVTGRPDEPPEEH